MTVLEENIRGSMGPQVKQRFLRHDSKTMVHKRKKNMINWTSSKFKYFVLQKTPLRK